MTIPTDAEAAVLQQFDAGIPVSLATPTVRQTLADLERAGWLECYRTKTVYGNVRRRRLTDAGKVALMRYLMASEPHPPITHLKPGEPTGIPMLLTCPSCGERHVDEGEWETKPHHTHACQSCGMVWRPAIVNTVGVRFLPGFRNEGGQQ